MRPRQRSRMKVIRRACPTFSVLNAVQVTSALLLAPSRRLAFANRLYVDSTVAFRKYCSFSKSQLDRTEENPLKAAFKYQNYH